MKTRIAQGENSLGGVRQNNNPLEVAVSEALDQEYRLNMTDVATAEIEIERLGNDKLTEKSKLLGQAVSQVQHLHEQIQKDMTRRDTEKLHLFSQRAEPMLKAVNDVVDELSRLALAEQKKVSTELFSTKSKLSELDQIMLPKVADALASDTTVLTTHSATQSEAKLMLHMTEHYPSLVHADQRIGLEALRADFDSRFTEDAYKQSVIARDAVKAVHALVPSLRSAREAVLPSETMKQLKAGRVA